jgi:hypothetical protein
VQQQPVTHQSPFAPGQLLAGAGVVAAGLAVWLVPLVFGPLGMLFGVLAVVRGERRGRWVIVIAAAALVLGLLVSLLPPDQIS